MNRKVVNKILVIALHVCGWALLFLMPFRFMGRASQPEGQPRFPHRAPPDEHINHFTQMDPHWFRVESLVTNVMLAIFFYTNMFVFIPKVLHRKGWGQYMALVVASFALYLLVGYLLRMQFMPVPIGGGRHGGPPFLIGVPFFLMVFGLSLALRIMQDRAEMQTILQERENEKLKSELSFLRSQVSPHFMFNVLNSLASLARKKSDKVEAAIIQLSQLMRYSLYHTDKKVTLEQEADYLNNYIELQKLRFGATVNMHFHVNIERRQMMLEPMLLVPFVENAFKHGVGLISDPVINISLQTTPYEINFSVRNKFNPSADEMKDESSGIGIQNVKRRLDLLYKDMYTLSIYKEDNWFITELKIIGE